MTNEEAIITFKNECYEICKREDGNCCECLDVAYKMAIKALENAEKYKWHDLRKNPEDLPDIECVLIAIEYPGRYRNYQTHEVATYSHDKWDTYLNPIKGEVVAWREIEPFESEEV